MRCVDGGGVQADEWCDVVEVVVVVCFYETLRAANRKQQLRLFVMTIFRFGITANSSVHQACERTRGCE